MAVMVKTLEDKLEELRKSIHKLDSALAAVSGEVDNSFLVRILRQELGDKAVALKTLSASYPSSELSMARRVARIMDTGQTQAPEYSRKSTSPPRDMRTYSSLKSLAMRTKLETSLRKAAESGNMGGKGKSLILFRHAGLQSPILESSTSKGEVRLLAKELGLPNWEHPGSDAEAKSVARKTEVARKYIVSLGFRDVTVIVRGKKISIGVCDKDLVYLTRKSTAIIGRMRLLGFSEVLLKLC
jgi:uncharacterized protein